MGTSMIEAKIRKAENGYIVTVPKEPIPTIPATFAPKPRTYVFKTFQEVVEYLRKLFNEVEE